MTAYPKDFVWGAASSAYQIEGDPLADGGGPSVWDTFSHTPGKTFEGNTGDTACRSYRHPERDIEHLKHLGLTAYRFSTSWARIDPKGTGDWNPLGLAYYDRLVDLCLQEGITPYMTLYHWELPQALEDRGGWLNPETPKAFARFASMMAGHFRGRVSHYFLLNEPQCVAALGYGSGIHACVYSCPGTVKTSRETCLMALVPDIVSAGARSGRDMRRPRHRTSRA